MKPALKTLFYAAVFFAVCPSLFHHGALFGAGESADDAIAGAAQAYYENRLDEAEKTYLELVDSGVNPGHLFYNLGNIYYRKGHLGQAVLYYKKAVRFIPRDADLRANLKFVTDKRVDDFSADSRAVQAAKTLLFWHSWLTLDESVFVLAVLCAFLFLIGFFHVLSRRDIFKWIGGAGLVVFVAFTASSGLVYYEQKVEKMAVVVSPQAGVRPTIFENDKTILELHEGAEVRILSEAGHGGRKWFQIKLPGGEKGWVMENDIGII